MFPTTENKITYPRVRQTFLACISLYAAVFLRLKWCGIYFAVFIGIGEVKSIADNGVGCVRGYLYLSVEKGKYRCCGMIACNPIAAYGGEFHTVGICSRLDQQIAFYVDRRSVHRTFFIWIASVESVMNSRAGSLA